jgi:hypothetical protein
VPVRLGINDRHYLCCRVSSKKLQDVDYFGALHDDTNTQEFYQSLTQFLQNFPLDNYRPYDGLMNEAKRNVIMENTNLIDNFVIANYGRLCSGMASDKIVPLISSFGFKSKDAFWKKLGVVCDKNNNNMLRKYVYTLKDWAQLKYMSIASHL